MKQNPQQQAIREDMAAGRLARDGFMGEDSRPYEQIIADDSEALNALGVSQEQIADKMEALTKKGLEGMGEKVQAGDYAITVDEYMGKFVCPFHDHRAAKRNTHVTESSGRSLSWSDLSIHLIRTHGFFQGKGSAFRLEPAELAKFLQLNQ